MLKKALSKLLSATIRTVRKQEFYQQRFESFNERSIEYRFVFENLASLCPKQILDVGTGLSALPSLMRTCGFSVTAIDNLSGYWTFSPANWHYYVIKDDILNTTLKKNSFDCITCISTLEHIRAHDIAVKNMVSLLKIGGHLVLTFPYTENTYVENVYALPGSIGAQIYPFITQSFSRREIMNWEKNCSLRLLKQEYWQLFSGQFWTIGERLAAPKLVSKSDNHQISCLLFARV